MDALDYEKLLNQLIRLEGDRLDRERLTVLEEDVRAVAQELEEGWPAVRRIDSVRKRVLIHMTFNMEVRGVLAMQRFVSAVEFRLWVTAADEMLISQWAKQEPRRASVLAAMMRTGRDEVLKVIQP
jgi:hypothetical protein